MSVGCCAVVTCVCFATGHVFTGFYGIRRLQSGFPPSYEQHIQPIWRRFESHRWLGRHAEPSSCVLTFLSPLYFFLRSFLFFLRITMFSRFYFRKETFAIGFIIFTLPSSVRITELLFLSDFCLVTFFRYFHAFIVTVN